MTRTYLTSIAIAFVVVAALVLTGCGGSSIGAPPANLTPAASVTPELVNPWQAGDAAFECEEAGCTAKYAYKVEWSNDPLVDPDGPNGVYVTPEGNTITISNYDSTTQTFDWTSTWPVCTVIVKGGPAANIFRYGPPGVYGDTALYPPTNPKNNKPYGVSHFTFCFNDPPMCWQQETAWADGPGYIGANQWATYTPYVEGATVDIYAGQTMLAGTATFSAVVDGKVTITIELANEFVFYQADPDNPDTNLKVQDYEEPPSGNPSPGHFEWKKIVDMGETSTTIEVDANNYYGIHLDVAYPVPSAG